MTIVDIWQKTFKETPEKCAVSWSTAHTSYHFTYAQIETMSNWLAQNILSKTEANDNSTENIIAILSPQGSPLWIISALACWKVGKAAMLLDASLPIDKIDYRLKQANTHFVITDDDHHELLEHSTFLSATQPPLSFNWQAKRPATDVISLSQCSNIEKDALAYICFTSGSTGKPKAVAITHAGIPGLIESHLEYLQLSENDKSINLSSLSFDVSWMNCFLMMAGVECLLWSPIDMSFSNIDKIITENNVTFSIFIPTLLAQLTPNNFPTLTKLLTTGEAASAQLLDRWLQIDTKNETSPRNIVIGYGPTEDTVGSSLATYHSESHYCTLGKPMQGRALYLLDEHLQEITEPHVEGELYLAGEGLARGYLQDGQISTELMKEKFINISDMNLPIPYPRIYRSGDLAALSEKHELLFKGRVDRQIKLRGRRVELDEIEREVSTVLFQNAENGLSIKIACLFSEINSQQVIGQLAAVLLHPDNLPAENVLNIVKQAKLKLKDKQDMPDVWYSLSSKNAHSLQLIDPTKNKFNIKECEKRLNDESDSAMADACIPIYLEHDDHETCVVDSLTTEIGEDLKKQLGIAKDIPLAIVAKIDFLSMGINSLNFIRLTNTINKRYNINITRLLESRLRHHEENFFLRDLVTLIVYQIVHQLCFKEIIPSKDKLNSLYCFPPISGNPCSSYAKLEMHWREEKVNLGVTGFISPAIIDQIKTVALNETQQAALEHYQKHQLGENLDLMSDSITSLLTDWQRQGPYYLTGYSWGCDLAHAVASKLQKMKHRVAWLALVDGARPGLLRESLLQNNRVLHEEVFQKIFSAIATSLHIKLPDINREDFINLTGTPQEKLAAFSELIMTRFDECTLTASHLNRETALNDLKIFLQSCITNFAASVSAMDRQIIDGSETVVTLYHTPPASASLSCLTTNPLDWQDFIPSTADSQLFETSHLKLFDDETFLQDFTTAANKHLTGIASQDTSSTKHQAWGLPSRNASFTGRQKQVNELVEIVSNKQHKDILIHGIGGVGKSQILAEVAHCLNDSNRPCSLVFLGIDNLHVSINAYLVENHILQANETISNQTLIEMFFSQLKQLPNPVLIIDNLETYQQIKPHIFNDHRRSDELVLLCAARSAARLPNTILSRRIDVLDDIEATAYISSKLADASPDEVTKLSTRLANFPLAISLAVAYCAKEDMSITDYIAILNESLYETQGDAVWDVIALEENYNKTLMSILNTNLDAIKQHRDSEKLILLIHAIILVHNENIPLPHLIKFMRSAGALSESDTVSKITLKRYLGILADMGLIEISDEKNEVRMHQLTHEILIELCQAQLPATLTLALSKDTAWVEYRHGNPQLMTFYQQYWRHLITLWDNISKFHIEHTNQSIKLLHDLYYFYNFHYADIDHPGAVQLALNFINFCANNRLIDTYESFPGVLGELLYFIGMNHNPNSAVELYKQSLTWSINNTVPIQYGIFRLATLMPIQDDAVDVQTLYNALVDSKQYPAVVLLGLYADYHIKIVLDYPKAYDLYTQQKIVRELMLKAQPGPRQVEQLAVCLQGRAYVAAILQKYATAITDIARAIKYKKDYYGVETNTILRDSLTLQFSIYTRAGITGQAKSLIHSVDLDNYTLALYSIGAGEYNQASRSIRHNFNELKKFDHHSQIIQSNLAVTFIRLGQLHMSLGNYAKATEHFATALQKMFAFRHHYHNYCFAYVYYVINKSLVDNAVLSNEFQTARRLIESTYGSDQCIFSAMVDIYEAKYWLRHNDGCGPKIDELLQQARKIIDINCEEYPMPLVAEYYRALGDLRQSEAELATNQQDKVEKIKGAFACKNRATAILKVCLDDQFHPLYIQARAESLAIIIRYQEIDQPVLIELLKHHWTILRSALYPKHILKMINTLIHLACERLCQTAFNDSDQKAILNLYSLMHVIHPYPDYAVLASIAGNPQLATQSLQACLAAENKPISSHGYLIMAWVVHCFNTGDYLSALNWSLYVKSIPSESMMSIFEFELPFFDDVIAAHFNNSEQFSLTTHTKLITCYYGAKAALLAKQGAAYDALIDGLIALPSNDNSNTLKQSLIAALQNTKAHATNAELPVIAEVLHSPVAGTLLSHTIFKSEKTAPPRRSSSLFSTPAPKGTSLQATTAIFLHQQSGINPTEDAHTQGGVIFSLTQ